MASSDRGGRPVKTFTTACTYYHLFRLCHRDAEYNYQDASLASLFMACKVEDTIKKSREILCAAYNIKNPTQPTTQDDKVGDPWALPWVYSRGADYDGRCLRTRTKSSSDWSVIFSKR